MTPRSCAAPALAATWALARGEATAPDRPAPSGPLMLAAHIGLPAAVPLLEDPVPSCSLALLREDAADLHAVARVLLFTRRVLRYALSPVFACDPRWVLFCELPSDALRRAPEAFRRSQALFALRSAPVGEGCALTPVGDCELFARRSRLREVLAADARPPQIENFDARSAQSVPRGSGTSARASQQRPPARSRPALRCRTRSTSRSTGATRPSSSPGSRTRSRGGRSCGPGGGSRRSAAARSCSGHCAPGSSRRRRRSPSTEPSGGSSRARAFADRAAEYSARDSDPEEVDRAVVTLIHSSLEKQDELFAIPWI
jgi:hypothetical protein